MNIQYFKINLKRFTILNIDLISQICIASERSQQYRHTERRIAIAWTICTSIQMCSSQAFFHILLLFSIVYSTKYIVIFNYALVWSVYTRLTRDNVLYITL